MQPFIGVHKLGFEGCLPWIHNEEGSGDRYYNSSVYYPDSMSKPRTKSGVTLDPGVDLGNSSPKLCKEVIGYFASQGELSSKQIVALKNAIGLKKEDAIAWMKFYIHLFKGKFNTPDEMDYFVMENYTAAPYWKPLKEHIPSIVSIKPLAVRKAIHTALLSNSYNRGSVATINLAKEFVEKEEYQGLARAIRGIKHTIQSLRDRRDREALLIESAIIRNKFEEEFLSLNPRPFEIIREISL